MNVNPLTDLVMVQVCNVKKERSGIIIAKEVQPDLAEGKAVAYGPDVPSAMREDIEMSAGGVIYGAFDHEAHTYEQNGEKYLFIRAKDLMGSIFLGRGDRFPRIQSALGKWVLMEWEEAKDTILGGLLLRPVQKAKAHFTGTVIMAGPAAPEVERGKRYFFEQFSDFKSWEEGGKRYAFVPYSSIYCEIPEREADVHLAPSEVADEAFEASMR